jgi:TRAP-type uncharacterized transport system substrate-binding protein
MADLSVGMAETVRWTYRAEGAYDGWRHTSLRALAALQYSQWLGIAARWECGIRTLEDLRSAENLRLLAPLPGGASATWSFIVGRVLGAHGASPGDLARRGWRVEDISNASTRMRDADFDVLVAPIGAPGSLHARTWQAASTLTNLRFLALPDTLLTSLSSEYDLHAGTLSPEYLRGIEAPIATVGFTDWLVVASERLEDDVAVALYRAFEARRQALLPLHASLDPLRSFDELGVPVHRAVKRYRQQRPAIAARAEEPTVALQVTASASKAQRSLA